MNWGDNRRVELPKSKGTPNWGNGVDPLQAVVAGGGGRWRWLAAVGAGGGKRWAVVLHFGLWPYANE
ncbi:hypothetical protein GBA52_008900 [Prunus armeniaca]|nr:hypothetical protein GBA52_008900 [Prunus armeniaca]